MIPPIRTTLLHIVIQNAEQPQDAENSALGEDQWRPAPGTGREGQVWLIFISIFNISLQTYYYFHYFSIK